MNSVLSIVADNRRKTPLQKRSESPVALQVLLQMSARRRTTAEGDCNNGSQNEPTDMRPPRHSTSTASSRVHGAHPAHKLNQKPQSDENRRGQSNCPPDNN